MIRVVSKVSYRRPTNSAEKAASQVLDKCAGLMLPDQEAYELLKKKVSDTLDVINEKCTRCANLSASFYKDAIYLSSFNKNGNKRDEFAYIHFTIVRKEWKGGEL